MKNSVSNKEEPLTPEIVLAILRDSHLQQCQYDPEAESEIELSFTSTVAEWRVACDLVTWKPLGRALNRWFGIRHSDDQWRAVLEPAKQRTLLAVCELIASTATRPAIVPLKLFGNNCLEAGVFVRLKIALADAGLPVDAIRPSTPLAPWLVKHWGGFSDVVGKLAPEALPPVKIEDTFLQWLSYRLLTSGIVLAALNVVIRHDFVTTLAVTLLVTGFLSNVIASDMSPKAVSFGDLETFADVCRLIGKSMKASGQS